MKYFWVFLMGVVYFFSCKKEEPVIPNYCINGNVYIIDSSTPLYPVRVKDSFFFDPAEGVHILHWNADSLNSLTIKVKRIPSVDSTIVYKKSLVSSMSSFHKGLTFTSKNDKDSILTIKNLKDSFIVNINAISMYNKYTNSKSIKGCQLIMTDVKP